MIIDQQSDNSFNDNDLKANDMNNPIIQAERDIEIIRKNLENTILTEKNLDNNECMEFLLKEIKALKQKYLRQRNFKQKRIELLEKQKENMDKSLEDNDITVDKLTNINLKQDELNSEIKGIEIKINFVEKELEILNADTNKLDSIIEENSDNFGFANGKILKSQRNIKEIDNKTNELKRKKEKLWKSLMEQINY